MKNIFKKFVTYRALRATQSSRGFTLIETIMAMSILVVGVVGAFLAISATIRIAPASREELIAANLAQEGVEILRNIRDTSLLEIADETKQGIVTAHTWTELIASNCTPLNYEKIVHLTNTSDLTAGWQVSSGCSTSNDRRVVFLDPVSGFYANCQNGNCPGGWVDSGFRRAVDLVGVPAGCSGNACTEYQAKVMVWWNASAMPLVCPGPGCVILEDRLTNWVNYLTGIL